MVVYEANRARHLVIRIDRGEEIPTALMRALGDGEARSAWIQGFGELEAVELAVYDQARRAYGRARRIDTPTTLLSLQGNATVEGGVLSLRLAATLARETDVGLEVVGGQLVWARAFSVELCVTAFDDLALGRAADERTGLATLEGRRSAAALEAAAPAAPTATPARAPIALGAPTAGAPPGRFTSEPEIVRTSSPPQQPSSPPQQTNDRYDGPTIPPKPVRAKDEIEVYPEIGDAVMHFHFGECTVVGSDGDRIRLRQDKDGRMREVALAMLKIEGPTELADGKRFFKLSRKN